MEESYEYNSADLDVVDSFTWFVNNKWDFCESVTPQADYKEYILKKNAPKKPKTIGKKFVFVTIQDFKRRITDLDDMVNFMKKIEYIFEECIWCIESGKVPLPDSNLHIHLLAKYRNSKKGKNQLCIEWSKFFDTNLRDKDYFKLQQHRDSPAMPSYEDWVKEKMDYFDNEMKGTHENAIDLNCRGSWG